jgi:hypothetical protein
MKNNKSKSTSYSNTRNDNSGPEKGEAKTSESQANWVEAIGDARAVDYWAELVGRTVTRKQLRAGWIDWKIGDARTVECWTELAARTVKQEQLNAGLNRLGGRWSTRTKPNRLRTVKHENKAESAERTVRQELLKLG